MDKHAIDAANDIVGYLLKHVEAELVLGFPYEERITQAIDGASLDMGVEICRLKAIIKQMSISGRVHADRMRNWEEEADNA